MPPKPALKRLQSPRKPFIERRRRQRINESLCQIRQLIPRARELEITRGGKLEKAEVLEIAVQFIRETVASGKQATPEKPAAHEPERRQEEYQGNIIPSQIATYGSTVQGSNGARWNYSFIPPQYPPNLLLHSHLMYRPTPRKFTPTICHSSSNLNSIHAFPKSTSSLFLVDGCKSDSTCHAGESFVKRNNPQ